MHRQKGYRRSTDGCRRWEQQWRATADRDEMEKRVVHAKEDKINDCGEEIPLLTSSASTPQSARALKCSRNWPPIAIRVAQEARCCASSLLVSSVGENNLDYNGDDRRDEAQSHVLQLPQQLMLRVNGRARILFDRSLELMLRYKNTTTTFSILQMSGTQVASSTIEEISRQSLNAPV
jgi:hypothetical protein